VFLSPSGIAPHMKEVCITHQTILDFDSLFQICNNHIVWWCVVNSNCRHISYIPFSQHILKFSNNGVALMIGN